jgi:glutamate/aspartate transport system substrate-binding protein
MQHPPHSRAISVTPEAHAHKARFAPGALANLALGALLCLAPAAHAKKADSAASAASQADVGPHPVLDRIRSSGRIVLAHRESSVPFSYYDANKKPVGYALDLCKDVAEAVRKHLGLKTLEIAYVPITTATRIDTIASGKADLECGSTTNNAERKRQVAFSNTYFLTASRYVFKKASGINTIDDMKGKTVVSTSGSTNIKQLTEVNAARKLGINIIAAKDHAEGFLMVETDRAVAFVMDDVLLASFIASSKDPSLYVIGTEAFSKPEPYALMLRRDDTPFKTLVDQTTAKLYGSPDGIALYNKWFTQPIPPRGLNLNLPLSPELAKSFQAPTDDSDPAHYGT